MFIIKKILILQIIKSKYCFYYVFECIIFAKGEKMDLIKEYLITIGWGLAGAIAMSIALPILIFVFDKFTPINEWEEVKNGNIGVAIIIAALIIGFAIVMGMSIIPGA
jgi:formate hydrogenlyase subunit 3/multisubunit Na+/H+ antiporter MnhD subunit